jgi:hypothetical protein
MATEIPETPFEVYCTRCRVTAPVGTKHCLHCGNRISRHRGTQSVIVPSALETGHGHLEAGAAPGHAELPADEEMMARPRRLSPMSVVWIVAALAVAIQRTCAN